MMPQQSAATAHQDRDTTPPTPQPAVDPPSPNHSSTSPPALEPLAPSLPTPSDNVEHPFDAKRCRQRRRSNEPSVAYRKNGNARIMFANMNHLYINAPGTRRRTKKQRE